MSQTITDSQIVNQGYTSKAISSIHQVSRPLVRQADGTLWCLYPASNAVIHLLKSTDNGFSWDIIRRDISNATDIVGSGKNYAGPLCNLIIDELHGILDVYFIDEFAGSYDVNRRRYDLDTVATDTPTDTTILSGVLEGSYQVRHNHDEILITYIGGSNDLEVRRLSPRTTSISSAVSNTDTATYNMFGCSQDENGHLDIIYTNLETSHRIKHVRYDLTTPSMGTPVEIKDVGGTSEIAKDIDVAQDGYGTICGIWGLTNNGGGTITIEYSYSTDNGSTWNTSSLSRTSGHAVYTDPGTTAIASKCRIIGGADGGFLLMYTEDDSSGVPKTYIRQLTTSDSGSTYDLQSEQEIATGYTQAADEICGGQFFYPTDVKLMDLSDPGLVRVAYQIGDGETSEGVTDTIPTSIGQELLFSSAFATQLASESGSYSTDTPGAGETLVDVNILGGPEDNVDFYDLGLTGKYTDKYERAFNRIGTHHRLLKYQPDADNYMDDRSAFDSPTEHSALLVVDPESYAFPTPQLSQPNTVNYIEQDVRKIYLAPSFHLARTFLVNKGGYLKRTVWILKLVSNDYEISQVVPRFIDNQICYYEANAYVIGPSRDPFSRTVLPSET